MDQNIYLLLILTLYETLAMPIHMLEGFEKNFTTNKVNIA
jgi:hypothetical protein